MKFILICFLLLWGALNTKKELFSPPFQFNEKVESSTHFYGHCLLGWTEVIMMSKVGF